MKWHLRDYIVMAMAMGLGALIVETLGWTSSILPLAFGAWVGVWIGKRLNGD